MKHNRWLLAGWVCAGSLFSPCAVQGVAPSAWRASAETNAVAVTRADWLDAKRDRTVPVKIYAPQSGGGPFPLVLFSHGLGGTREGYEYLGQSWAAHGYVVVHLQHPGSDESVWKDVSLGQRLKAMQRAAAQPHHALDRMQDVTLAIDELTRLNATNSPWRGRLDLKRIGLAGHSFGAHTTLATAGAVYSGFGGASRGDPRVRALIPMSSPVPGQLAQLDAIYGRVKLPCLHMTGTADSSPIGDTKAADRRLPFDHCGNSDQFLITFTGGDHAVFGGRERRRGGAKDATFQALIVQSSIAFWDAYLRDAAPAKAWLTTEFQTVLGKEGVFEVKLQK